MDNAISLNSRFILTPEALTDKGVKNIPCDLRVGESLHEFLSRHVDNVDSGAWTVAIGGRNVPQKLWKKVKPKDGQTITCRCVVRGNVLKIVAMAVLSYFTFGVGGLGAGGLFATGGLVGGGLLAASGAYIAGAMIINKVLGPKPSKASAMADNDDRSATYSLTSQTNTARQYAPVGTVFGVVDVAPDLLSNTYTWYEGQEQFLGINLCAGINVHTVENVRLGTDPLSNYSDVKVAYTGIPGMPQNTPLIHTNVQAMAGGELDDEGSYVTRTTPEGVSRVQLDLEFVAFRQNTESGAFEQEAVRVLIEYKSTDSSQWISTGEHVLRSSTSKTQRYTWAVDLPTGSYDIRAKRTDGATGSNYVTRSASLFSIKSYKPDNTDYGRWGQITLSIRATGQLSGSVPTVFATFKGRPIPVWNGNGWVTATDRATGLSNPGAILLQIARGIYDYNGKLQFGFGLEDEYIDIEGMKAFMLHCEAHGFYYDKWITDSVALEDLCAEIALAGMGEFAWKDGASPSVRFASSNQPKSTEVNMANMGNASFEATYTLAQSADGVEYSFLNRDKGWASDTIRVMAPGALESINPVRLTGAGITSAEHAAKLARFHLAQSLYQFKDVKFDMDIEHLDFRRLALIGVSHDLTRWGHGGRLRGIKQVAGGFEVELDAVVTPAPQNYIGLRVPGERSYRVFPVEAFTGETTKVKFLGEWPIELDYPGSGPDNPVFDTLWCLDFKPSPGLRMRVTSITPTDNLKGATISCVPEPDELWNYVYNGVYEDAPNSSYPVPHVTAAVHSLRVSDHVNLQGDSEWYELQVLWETSGDYGYAQVWAAPLGNELALVSPLALNSAVFRIESAGEWRIQVRPFTPDGRTGIAATIGYATDRVARPPRVPDTFAVSEIANGMRRYFWGWNGTAPINLRGVRIRYTAGFKSPEQLDWAAMTPLGGQDIVFPAYFEHSLPDVGPWTFAIKSVNASGISSEGFRTLQKNLTVSPEDEYVIDPTPAPTPTGVSVSAAFSSAIVETDAPTYTVGHGHSSTVVYVAEKIDETSPAFGNAKKLASFDGNIGAIPVELGRTYYVWVKWKTNDGYESDTPAGPVTLTVGKIGNADLGDLIIEAKNLADNAVSGQKLAAGAVDRTKFANGIEPVTNVTGSVLPTVKSTTTITFQGKLYRWDGTKYTVEVDTVDLVGTISKEQIAAGAVDATKFASGIEPVTIVSGSTLPTAKSTSTIVFQGKLYRWNGTKYTAEVATVDLTGQIDSSKLADNAVTVGKIAAGAVEAGKLAKDAVTSEKLAAGAVDATKFASGIEPVTNVAGTVVPTTKSTTVITVNGKLYRWNGTKYTAEVVVGDMVGQITATQIADNAISTPKLAANAVSADKIAANAVTADKVAANSITTAKIAAGAVTATEIAAKAITSEKLVIGSAANMLADGDFSLDGAGWAAPYGGTTAYVTVVDGPLGVEKKVVRMTATSTNASSYNTDWRADRPVDSGLSLYLSYTARKTGGTKGLARVEFILQGTGKPTLYRQPAGSIDLTSADSLGWSTRTGTYVVPEGYTTLGVRVHLNNAEGSTVEFADIQLRTMSTGELIVDGAITAGKLAANSVTAASIAAGTITATELAANSVTTAKIAAGAVTTNELATNSVTAVKIAAGSISADKIASNAITSDKISANAITSAKIAAGAVTATEIAAKAITAEKLVVTASGTVNRDPFFEDETLWDSRLVRKVVDGSPGPYVMSSSISMNGALDSSLSPIDATKTYLFETWYKAQAATTNRAFAIVRFYDKDKNILRVIAPGWPGGNATGGNHYFPSVGTVTPQTWTKYSVIVGPEGAAKMPDGAVYFALGTYLNYNGVAPVVETLWGGIRVTEMASGELIVDGAVTADKIAAKTITAAQLAAGTITATELAANSVTTAKIAAGAVTANELATNSVTAVKIAAGSISADKIASNAITSDKISANAITSAKIAAGAVTATEIAAGAITASKLVVGDTTNLVADPDFADRAAWSAGVTNYEFVAGEVADGVSMAAEYSAAPKTGTANSYAGEIYSKFVAVGVGKRLYISVMVRSYAGSTGTLQLGIVARRSDGTTYTDTVKTVTLGASEYTKLEGLATVAENFTAVAVRVRHQFSSGGSFGGKHRLIDPQMRVMASGELIVDGAVTADKMSANAITADKISANAVTTAKIAANAVTANEIAANAITTAKIAAGAVNADQIAANAITVKHLTVMDYSNIVLDPYMQDASSWSEFNAGFEAITPNTAGVPAGMPGPAGRRASRGSSTAIMPLNTRNFQVNPGDTYYTSAWVATNKLAGRNFVMQLRTFANNGSEGGANGTHIAYLTAVNTGLSAINVWQKVEGFVTIPESTTNPAALARLRVVVEGGTADASSYFFITNLMVRRAASANLVVDGAITADKIAVNAIAVGTAAIQNGAIVNAMIANATIDNAKIASLSAAKITAGSMQVGSYIQSSTYTAGSAGWRIHANGSAEFSNVTVRGNIQATGGTIAGFNISSNGLNAGAYTGYAWPSGTGTGVHLSSTGLLLGNPNGTKGYAELHSDGYFSIPGLTSQNQVTTFKGYLDVQSATSGARLRITNSQVLVYDANNVLRVRLGIW